jgi:hypothetical protein
MNSFFTIIKSDYLQRTRSSAFLITLCASLAIAYTFVPEPNASYSTIRIADYVGYYNSAWFGYVTAIMTSLFLSLIGFYLVNSSIDNDVHTKVGQIIASTSISNFKYLFTKVLSNFLVLLTIAAMVFIMSILLFFLYNDGFSFELIQFVKPYVIIVIPSLFLISALAIIFEIFFGKYSVLQNLGFFFVFSTLMVFTPKSEEQFSLDIFGSKIIMHQLEQTVRKISNTSENVDITIGYVLANVEKVNKFEFNGVDFPTSFIISRIVWIAFGVLLIFIISHFFHRFNLKERQSIKKVYKQINKPLLLKEINLSALPIPQINYGIFPLLKTEFLLLFRKEKKWLWLLNIIGMLLLATLPLKIAHQMVLPILWFLQVSRLSDLTTKETTNNVHYFAFTSYKPISRLLIAQLMSAIILMLLLALPLLVRFGFTFNFLAVSTIILGSVFIVVFAAMLGIVSKGKKLFEVLFFMITYANINGVPFADYFGGFEHHQLYVTNLVIIIIFFGGISVFVRKHQLYE